MREHDLIPHDNDIDCPIHESADIAKVEAALVADGFFPLRAHYYKGDMFGISAALPGGRHSVEDPWDVQVDIWKQYSLNATQVFEPYDEGALGWWSQWPDTRATTSS